MLGLPANQLQHSRAPSHDAPGVLVCLGLAAAAEAAAAAAVVEVEVETGQRQN